ncbi:hypothetical protein FH039_08685 [Thermococcus indicus]|uniref:Uncharacterized protein n=1 Tax=Thermococcus indicus TaxID=2586643 RepID=A0A4Y5SLA1_9EURY|nr:hypothetical protein [Thermococcus indicus]QDA31658.1 hypothetical protein FH039_08685 [Thermococcus indicus]
MGGIGYRRYVSFIIMAVASLWVILEPHFWRSPSTIFPVLVIAATAWSDYLNQAVPTKIIYAAFISMSIISFESFLHSYFLLPLFWAFTLALTSGKERIAYALTVIALPAAFISSRLWPASQTASWMLVGLMIGYTENVVMEDTAEGDIYLTALYFALLGPLAVIQYAARDAVGYAFFLKDSYGIRFYPVGAAMFVLSVPVLKTGPVSLGYPNDTLTALSAVVGLLALIYISRYGQGAMLFSFFFLTFIVFLPLWAISGGIPLLLPAFGIAMIAVRKTAGGFLHYHGFSTVTPGELRALIDGIAVFLTIPYVLEHATLIVPVIAITFSLWVLLLSRIEKEDISFLGIPEVLLAGIWLSGLFGISIL